MVTEFVNVLSAAAVEAVQLACKKSAPKEPKYVQPEGGVPLTTSVPLQVIRPVVCPGSATVFEKISAQVCEPVPKARLTS